MSPWVEERRGEDCGSYQDRQYGGGRVRPGPEEEGGIESGHSHRQGTVHCSDRWME